MGNIKYTMDELAEQFAVIPGMEEFPWSNRYSR